jgi:hypothetical protein
MTVKLSKMQLIDLMGILRKNHQENSQLYLEIKDILRLHDHLTVDKLFDITIENSEIGMIRELLTPKEEE